MTTPLRYYAKTNPGAPKAVPQDALSHSGTRDRIHGYGMGATDVPQAAGQRSYYPVVPGTPSAQGHPPMYAQVNGVQGGAGPAVYTPTPPAKPPRKRRTALWICVVIAVLCLIAAGVLFLLSPGGAGRARTGTPGQLEGKTAAEMQAELDRIVDEGMFNISIASVVQMESGSSPAELRIENVPGNRYLMQVTLVLDDTGQQIYQSGIIEPNFHIQQDELDVDLPAGVYDATATFNALDPETEEPIGQAAAKVLIQVQS